jgi:NAD-dependent dihydropyrimidine dehydrogenase PreA subunit
MSSVTIPREKIPWFPTINYDACTADQECLNFCKSGVFAWEEETARVVVSQPNNCVVGCDSCAQICPVEAITFPDKNELRATLRRLRAEAGAQVAVVGPASDESGPQG